MTLICYKSRSTPNNELPGKDLVNVHSNVIFLQTTVGSFTSRKFEDFREVNEYSETATKSVFNLAFGDYDESIKTINDLSVSNNGDSIKVLSKVASRVYFLAAIQTHKSLLQEALN
jgi:hypothetical protein